MADDMLPLTAPYKVRWGVFTPGSSAAKILPYDPSRLALLISASTTSSTFNCALGAGDGTGFGLAAVSTTPIEILWQKHGDIVFQELWSLAGGLGAGIAWITLSKV